MNNVWKGWAGWLSLADLAATEMGQVILASLRSCLTWHLFQNSSKRSSYCAHFWLSFSTKCAPLAVTDRIPLKAPWFCTRLDLAFKIHYLQFALPGKKAKLMTNPFSNNEKWTRYKINWQTYIIISVLFIYIYISHICITVSIPTYPKYSAKLQGDRLLGHLVLGRFDGHPGLRGSQFDHRHLWIRSTSDHHPVANSWYLYLSEYETRKQWNFYSDSRRADGELFFVGWEVGMLSCMRWWGFLSVILVWYLFWRVVVFDRDVGKFVSLFFCFIRVAVVVQVCRLLSKWTLLKFDAYYDTWFLYCPLALHNACPWMFFLAFQDAWNITPKGIVAGS